MSLNFETESETGFIRVSISRPSPRLKLSESQHRDRVRDHRIGRDRDQYRESRYTLGCAAFCCEFEGHPSPQDVFDTFPRIFNTIIFSLMVALFFSFSPAATVETTYDKWYTDYCANVYISYYIVNDWPKIYFGPHIFYVGQKNFRIKLSYNFTSTRWF